ncbi:MAG TPA: HupE/UreJ family protein [Gemmatimonadales bacterium]|nr:HupE/UreJ family protein [Gemmatimonadales bacterium]
MRIFAAIAAVAVVFASAVSAHDVPDDVTVQAWLYPNAGRLSVAVRVPLAAMRDVDVPLRPGGFVDLARVEPALRHAATVWLVQGIEVRQDGQALPPGTLAGVRLSLPSDKAFASFDGARAQAVGPPLDPSTLVMWEQGALDALIEFPLASTGGRLAWRADVRRLGQRVTTVLRLTTPDGGVRAFEWHGDPGLVELDPRWHQAALSFLRSGIDHVLTGADHLLFLLCIAIPLRRLRTLVLVVTSFTLAHAATLVAAAYGLAPGALWFPPLVETLIAASIVWMALENIFASAAGRDAETEAGRASGPALTRRWAITTAFGLVHGFGFSFALGEQLQFAGTHLLTSLLAFNVGVEIAQLVVIVAAASAVTLVFKRLASPRVAAIVLSAIAAHTGWDWLLERGAVLWQFPWPSPSAAALQAVGIWLALAIAAAAGAWGVRRFFDRRGYAHEATESVR